MTKKIRDLHDGVFRGGAIIKSSHKPGDLVKVRTTNYRGDDEYEYGFIVGEQKVEQLTLFPMLPVYMFETSDVQLHYPLNLEIISS